MSLLEVEKEEVIKFRDDTELERNQLLEQVWWQWISAYIDRTQKPLLCVGIPCKALFSSALDCCYESVCIVRT